MQFTTKNRGIGKKTDFLLAMAKNKSMLLKEATNPIPPQITRDSQTKNAVIFGNCLFDGDDGNYYMWTSCDSNEACGQDCYWTIPYACAVAGTVIGYCPDGCPAWAVEVNG